MGSSCCARRRNDGIVDEVEVDRAVRGQAAKLSPKELEQVVYRLSTTRRWGLSRIAAHTSYSRSHINAVMKHLGITETRP